MESFGFTPPPEIVFGAGRCREVPGRIGAYGRRVLMLTGRSATASEAWQEICDELNGNGGVCFHALISGEPSPEVVDEIVRNHVEESIDVVAAWGGGSVLDAGKAVSAMLPSGDAVTSYLEGVGTKNPDGRKKPFIAIPATAGTGSEATKNAVISRPGPEGFKKSLRHDNYVPDLAILDPELTLTCPPEVTAACGMDALTQLLEAFVSVKASPMTDALALSGLEACGRSLVRAVEDGRDLEARGAMLYAALASGICLANAGLGLVHGLASPIGGHFDIPHGVVCGTLAGAAAAAQIHKLCEESGGAHPALKKFTRAAAALTGKDAGDSRAACDQLIQNLSDLTDKLAIPRLGVYGMSAGDLDGIAGEGGNKNSPVSLSREEIVQVLRGRL